MTNAYLLALFAAATVVRAEDVAEKSCREFLAQLPVVYGAATGTHVAFTGQFVSIPADLTKDLQRLFPDYAFRIADMTYTHWGPEQVRLLLVLYRRGNGVCSYLWDVWFDDAPPSFERAFSQGGQAVEIAQERITALARLIAFQVGWTVGKVTVKDGVVSAALMDKQNEVQRIVRSDVSPKFPSDRLSIVPPDDKRETPDR